MALWVGETMQSHGETCREPVPVRLVLLRAEPMRNTFVEAHPREEKRKDGHPHSHKPRLFRVASLFAAGRGNLAKYSVVFVVGARCEKQFGGEATIGVIPAEAQRPQPIDP
jgi:hypothetical protein